MQRYAPECVKNLGNGHWRFKTIKFIVSDIISRDRFIYAMLHNIHRIKSVLFICYEYSEICKIKARFSKNAII